MSVTRSMVRALGWGWGLALTLTFVGCSSSSDKGPKAQMQLSVRASNAGAAGGAHGPAAQVLAEPPGDRHKTAPEVTTLSPSQAYNGAMASGAPDSFAVTIYNMTLNGKSTTGSSITIPIFQSTAGAPINITGSRVDLSGMFTAFECVDNHGAPYFTDAGESCVCGFDQTNTPIAPITVPVSRLHGVSDGADGGVAILDAGGGMVTICPQDLPDSGISPGAGGQVTTLEAEVGDYDYLQVTFGAAAEVSGCVSGNFASYEPIHGPQTFCTQAAYPLFEDDGGAPSSSDFPSSGPETTVLDLVQRSNGPGATSSTFGLNFPLASHFTLAAGAKAPLTMLIDTNRMLRFFAHENLEGAETGPLMNGPNDRSYFYTTVFTNSVYVFGGLPGGIYGFEWIASTCVAEDGGIPPLSSPSAYDCTGDTEVPAPVENYGIAAGWLTVVTDSNNVPFMGIAMPDDDHVVSGIKGDSSHTASGNNGPGTSAAFVPMDDAGTYSFAFAEGSEDGGLMGGTLYGIPLDAPVSDTPIPSLLFQGEPAPWSDGTGGPGQAWEPTFGIVTVVRKL